MLRNWINVAKKIPPAGFTFSHDSLAASLAVSRQTLRFWLIGQVIPLPEARVRMQELIGIPSGSWEKIS